MAKIKRVKLVNVRRERGRLSGKLHTNNALLTQLDQQMSWEHGQMVDARMERDRIRVQRPARNQKLWVLHGHIKDADGHPMSKQNVGLYREENMTGQPVATVTTNKEGYYKFDQSWEARQPGKEGGDAQAIPRDAIYIGVQDAGGDFIHQECRPVRAALGGLSYRDIKVDVVTRTGTENYPTRLLGNSGSRELHDLNNEKKNCFISKIRPDRRIYFRTNAQAQKAGYDFCAQCFGRKASKR